MSQYRASNQLETQVEQAIAFGRSPEWMRAHLRVDSKFVAGVKRRMDAAAKDERQRRYPEIQTRRKPRPPCGTLRGYNWHRRYCEQPCDDCKDAMAQNAAKRRAAARARRQVAA